MADTTNTPDGSGLTVNITGVSPIDAAAVAREVGWQLCGDARVTHEPRVYALHSPYSYYADLWALQNGLSHPGYNEANVRMRHYALELGYEMEARTAEGKRAERIIRARERTGAPGEHEARTNSVITQLRSLATGGGATASASGGGAAAFVSPAFLLGEWAPFRGIARTFADQCYQCPLPPYGMEAYLPVMSSTVAVSQQTEGGAVTEATPETKLEGAEVKTLAGKLNLTQQLQDRGMTGGGSMDAIIHNQLHELLDQEVDLYALNQAITGGEEVAGASSYSTANLYEDLAKGREKLTDIAGTRLRPTHLFTTSDLYSYATRQVDGEERPIIEPRFVPGFPLPTGADDFDSGERPKWARFTGTVLPGGVLWFTDDNIPTVGTTTKTRLVVSAPAVSLVLMEDEPVLRVRPETLANELKVVLTLDEYVAAITRHAAGTAWIASAAYTTTLK